MDYLYKDIFSLQKRFADICERTSESKIWRLRESIKGMLSREQTKESGLQALNR